ncbi:sensor histidine kinase [Nonomuraea sp. NPDC050663]|uniref:sensor histidine kinase n=1 Tax=Nonomuraea sp. NPDC050663 TaxID=3364370 RepID=UPI0037AE73DD
MRLEASRGVDAGLAVLAGSIVMVTLSGPWYALAGLVAAAAMLLVRRVRPLLVTVVTLGADLAAAAAIVDAGGSAPLLAGAAATIASYSLGRHGGRAWLTGPAVAAGYLVATVAVDPVNPVGQLAQILAALGTGGLVRLRHALLERARRRAAGRAVAAERRRIARELHDVVAHHIGVINVLVGAGRTTMATDRAAAEEAFVTAERTAREAMTEMRQLLHVLRADEDAESGAAGGAAGVASLVEQARAPVTLEVDGEPVRLPAAVDHAVYRLVQESLTNARKHAPGAPVRVRLSYLPHGVEVEVVDDGPGPRARGRGGFGLRGMAERVELCGGLLSAGPRPEGGFRVHARLPVVALEEAGC